MYIVLHSFVVISLKAIEEHFPGAMLCDGPPLREGEFYYDVKLPDSHPFATEEDLQALTRRVDAYLSDLQIQQRSAASASLGAFQRIGVTRDFAKTLFAENPFKLAMIDRIPIDQEISLYRRFASLFSVL